MPDVEHVQIDLIKLRTARAYFVLRIGAVASRLRENLTLLGS